MKYIPLIFIASFMAVNAQCQTAITSVVTSTNAAASTLSYTSGANTYNWGLSPNNTETKVTGFTAGGIGYSYATSLTGNVKLRRVNNAITTGNFTLVWAEVVNTSATLFNIFPAYQNDMEAFFNSNTYNKGTDNFFDNTSSNSNDIERLDWILNTSYSTPTPSKVGFAIFERGATAAHDNFCIAAITSLDGSGNPATYGNIVRVVTANYGDPGPNVTYRIVKAAYPSNLLDAGTATQNRGGVIISLQNLGIAANTTIYGYSLFADDLPVSATPANLVDYTNTTYFPTTTGNPGGIDLVAVTGIYVDNSILPVRFTDFSAAENSSTITLKWNVENEASAKSYAIERSTDGINFDKLSEIAAKNNLQNANIYYYADAAIPFAGVKNIFYRIKQFDRNGSFYYSKTISIKLNNDVEEFAIYPNPIAETLQAVVYSTYNTYGVVSVINSAGQKLIKQSLQLVKGNNAFFVNEINKLPAGIYRLIINTPAGSINSKEFLKK
jgi:hypothetical protein